MQIQSSSPITTPLEQLDQAAPIDTSRRPLPTLYGCWTLLCSITSSSPAPAATLLQNTACSEALHARGSAAQHPSVEPNGPGIPQIKKARFIAEPGPQGTPPCQDTDPTGVPHRCAPRRSLSCRSPPHRFASARSSPSVVARSCSSMCWLDYPYRFRYTANCCAAPTRTQAACPRRDAGC